MKPLGAAYGRVAGLRRAWYAGHPDRRHRLDVPVVSVGNLVVGGSGKTPVVATIARLLQAAGERPAILSRGYRRRTRGNQVVIVSDGAGMLATVEESGDEPQMLARWLPGVPVVVCARRYRAGQVARARFDSTVLLLDDGFQHLELARDVELLIVSPAELDDQVLPAGTLREELSAARGADAVLVPGSIEDAARVAGAIGVARAFRLEAVFDGVRNVDGLSGATGGASGASDSPVTPAMPGAVAALAGIARPQRFFRDLRALGWKVGAEIVRPDHHWYDAADVAQIESAARDSGAVAVMTTEKDAVRLQGTPRSMPWFYLPLCVAIEPQDGFGDWLRGRIAAACSAGPAGQAARSR